MRGIPEYKSISSKITREESVLIETYCAQKGTTPSSLIRSLLLQEIKVPVPHHLAGNNQIEYNKEQDNFSWTVVLDDGATIDIMRAVSVSFLEDLSSAINKALKSRNDPMKRKKRRSVSVPSSLVKGKK